MKKYVILIFFFSFFWANVLAWCSDSRFVGIVKTVHPEAFIIRHKMLEKAVIGRNIFMGDVLKTGPHGSMGVIFNDDTVISMGPKTEIFIQTFFFEPAKGKFSFITKMVQGTISFISGQIAKLAPDSVNCETPVATIGLRGTHFLVQVKENTSPSGN
jgi:hypothetical protein